MGKKIEVNDYAFQSGRVEIVIYPPMTGYISDDNDVTEKKIETVKFSYYGKIKNGLRVFEY